jgi:hypothetical protein
VNDVPLHGREDKGNFLAAKLLILISYRMPPGLVSAP